MRKITLKSSLSVIAVALLVSACANPTVKIKQGTPANLYNTAINLYKHKQDTQAQQYFSSIATQYPISQYAANSLVYLSYMNYKSSNYLKSLNYTAQYIKLFGQNGKNLNFILYTAGLDNVALNYNFLQHFFGVNPARHGTYLIQNAKRDFGYVVTYFPTSIYAQDAKNRIAYLTYQMALHDTYQIKYYFNRRAYVGAINLIQEMYATYPKLNLTYKMFPYLIASYKALHLTQNAEISTQIWEQHRNIKYPTYTSVPKTFVNLQLPKLPEVLHNYNYYNNASTNIQASTDPYASVAPKHVQP